MAGPEAASDLERQLAFLLEIDRLKQVERRSSIVGGSRRENSAEHSWHLALVALVLAGHADEPVDVGRAVRMLLVHDLVEIDAGDTFLYDESGRATKLEREQACAERLFGMLPERQGRELRVLWEEYEHGDTPEARYARAVDRLQPLLLNTANEGAVWREHGVTADRVRAANAHIAEGSAALWERAQQLIDDVVARGLLAEAGDGDAAAR